ncbi:hypothetical protein MCP04_02770 [Leptolyngbya boryana IU 594]|nr:hypothetical protein MCP04_02770 [Leptolyngbya boryana IU 594]
MLNRRLQQELPEEVRSRLTTLSLPILQDLSEDRIILFIYRNSEIFRNDFHS